MKTHIMRLAVQDLNGSTIRKRALRLGRRELWLLYQDLLWKLYENGGYLPSDPAALVDEVDFFTVEEIADLLPRLAPVPGKVGGITVDGERIYNRRVLDELADEKAFSQEQAEKGRRGARARAKAIRSAAAIHKDSRGSTPVEHRPEPVQPAVAVSVAVPPSSSTSPSTAKEELAPSAPWNQRACELLTRRYGGTAPGGRITKALRPLVERYGESDVLTAWENYLDETSAEYVSAEKFSQTFGRWSGKSPPVGKKTRALAESSRAFLGMKDKGDAG